MEINVDNMEQNAELFMEKMGFAHDSAGLDMTDEIGRASWRDRAEG